MCGDNGAREALRGVFRKRTVAPRQQPLPTSQTLARRAPPNCLRKAPRMHVPEVMISAQRRASTEFQSATGGLVRRGLGCP